MPDLGPDPDDTPAQVSLNDVILVFAHARILALLPYVIDVAVPRETLVPVWFANRARHRFPPSGTPGSCPRPPAQRRRAHRSD